MEYLESIAARYEGEARVQRLLWIATQMTAAAAAHAKSQQHQDQQQQQQQAPLDASSSAPLMNHHHQNHHHPHAEQEPLQVAATAWNLLARHFQDMGNTYRYREVFALMAAANATVPTMQNHSSGSGSSNYAWPTLDANWLAQQEIRNRQARDVLQSRLSQAQAHLHKDAIRTAYLAIAEHELKISGGGSGSGSTTSNTSGGSGSGGGTNGGGGISSMSSSNLDPPTEAFHMVLRAKDYCVNRPQTAAVSLQILELALALKNYGSVREYVTKLEHTLDATSSNSNVAAGGGGAGANNASPSSNSMMLNGEAAHRVKVASALEALSQGDFHRAARVLVDLVMGHNRRSTSVGDGSSSSLSNTSSWPGVLCGEEIALYAALLALCCLSRSEIQQLAEHPEALELAPAMRECLWQFHRGNYHQACSNLLPTFSSTTVTQQWGGAAATTAGGGLNQVQLDVYLGPHLPQLQALIIQKAILAYWQPYARVDMATMARELGPGLVPQGTDFLLQHMIQVLSHSHAPSASSTALANIASSSSNSKNASILAAATATTKTAMTSTTKLLDTRIDLPGLTLVREQVDTLQDQEIMAQLKLQNLTASILDDTYSTVIRLACIEHDLVVGGGGGGDPTGRGGGGAGMWRQQRGSRARRNRGAAAVGSAPGGGRGEGMRSGSGSSSNNNPMEHVAGGAGFGEEGMMMGDDAGEDEMVSSDDEDEIEEDEEEHAMLDIADDMNPEDLY